MLGDGIVSFGIAVVTIDFRNVEVVAEDRVLERDPARRRCSAGRLNSMSPLGVVELRPHARSSACVIAAELVDEVHVPRAAAELAVGRDLEADVLLHPHRVADRLVLDGAQLVGVDRARRRARSRACSSSGGRSRLPTWSARNGGSVRFAMRRGSYVI